MKPIKFNIKLNLSDDQALLVQVALQAYNESQLRTDVQGRIRRLQDTIYAAVDNAMQATTYKRDGEYDEEE